MNFLIEYDKQAENFLKKSDRHITKRIMDKIDALLINHPIPRDAKPIVGEHGVFRIRIGDYRALYRVNYQENKVIVIKINKRSKVYD